MRIRIKKNNTGRSALGRKEVALRINKSGLAADGSQRYVVAVRFTGDSSVKASSSGYVAVEIDKEERKLYFVTGDASNGYKLTASSKTKTSTFKSITFAVDNIEEWRPYVGDYDLKKDISDGSYYIDLPRE